MKTRATVGVLVFAASQAFAGPARADETSDRTAAARRVLAIAFSPESYQKISDAMAAQLPEELRPEMAKILPSYQEIVDLQIDLFVKSFTTSELKEISRFYGSATGKKAIRVMPEIAAQAQGFVMKRLEAEMPKLMAKLKQQKDDSAPAPPSPPPAPVP